MKALFPQRRLRTLCCVAVCAGFMGAANAQATKGSPELNAALGEQVVMVPDRGRLFSPELETTLYRPPGEGPFPIVVINHGKAAGDTRFQARFRPAGAARFFLARGYAVVAPMRLGFSKSGGSYIGGGCNVESNGRVQAEDFRTHRVGDVHRPGIRRDQKVGAREQGG